MLQDLRYAVRGLIKQPAFSLVVIVTLALGIGANTAIFSVVHAVLLSPLPYGEPDRLVVLTARNQKRNQTKQPMAYLNLVDWQAQNHVFEHLAAIRGESFSLTYLGEPERVNGLRVSVNILSLLGMKPVLGVISFRKKTSPAMLPSPSSVMASGSVTAPILTSPGRN